MGKGSCYCGKVSFTYEGEPLNKVIATLRHHVIFKRKEILKLLNPGDLPLHRLSKDLRLCLFDQHNRFIKELFRSRNTQEILRQGRFWKNGHYGVLW